jgi:hypothetical protein
MTRRKDLPRQLTLAPFDVREALRLGVTPWRLDRNDLVRPYRGIRMLAGSADDLVSRCHAYQCRML